MSPVAVMSLGRAGPSVGSAGRPATNRTQFPDGGLPAYRCERPSSRHVMKFLSDASVPPIPDRITVMVTFAYGEGEMRRTMLKVCGEQPFGCSPHKALDLPY